MGSIPPPIRCDKLELQPHPHSWPPPIYDIRIDFRRCALFQISK
jgi:hypothetical protein